MRVVIAIAVLALIGFTVVNYIVFSNGVSQAYERALRAAREDGVQAGMEKYEVFADKGSWTTVFLHSTLRKQWKDDIATHTLGKIDQGVLNLLPEQPMSVESYRLYLRENFPDWEGNRELTYAIAKRCYERGMEFKEKDPDELYMPVDLENELNLAKYLEHLSTLKEDLPPDRREALAKLSSALHARYPQDRANYQVWLDAQPKSYDSGW